MVVVKDRAPIGRKGPVTPWGKPALGYKTRKKKASDKLIVRRRSKQGGDYLWQEVLKKVLTYLKDY